ncbi:hypothetical protein QNI19_21605 [Cytophagaceae bacterium DM2B3-1]|uniref:Leucine-rich repeat domain-containing protein n=1 Tax=Xanthocytophaga flava TaxID=3048013 RepID=A0ABT7CSA6_9BACT|nr:leucine-rich repeat domain-containing protein [Xanthocytophaga flavus]MDJ1495549.1 hypothetical protein [Xanthocytophaga flavus]
MSEVNSEKENVMRLLLSGQLENIELGLTLADSLQVDITEFKNDIEFLHEWSSDISLKSKDLSFQEKAVEIYSKDLVYLPHKNLTTIPSQIQYFKNVTKFDLSNNNLTRLSFEITMLAKLEIISLGNNQLELFPVEITKLSNLQLLVLTRNKIKSLPFEITNLEKLESLVLINNPISDSEMEKIKSWLPNCEIKF